MSRHIISRSHRVVDREVPRRCTQLTACAWSWTTSSVKRSPIIRSSLALALPVRRPPPCSGTSVPQRVPEGPFLAAGTIVTRSGSRWSRLSLEWGQVPLSGSDPLLGSLGWVEPLGGSTLEGPPVVRRLPLFQLGEVPEHTGQCPGSQWFPSGPSRNSSRNPGREVLGSKRFAESALLTFCT